MGNIAKFFAGWLVIFGVIALLVAPFVWGGATIGFICAFFVLPGIASTLLKSFDKQSCR